MWGSVTAAKRQIGRRSLGGLNNLSSAASGFLTGTSTTNNTANAVGGFGTTLANLPGGFSYFGRYGNDLDVVLEATAGNSRINVLSRPRIQTSHAVQADLFIGNTVPYVTGTYNYGYGSGPSSQYTQLEVGIHLQVMPLINPDGLVVMDIQADVEQLGPDVQIAGVGGVPTTTKRQAGAKVAVRNGETIILGGFISDSRSTAISGVPDLMNIPGLGNLFRSTSIENLRTELIMLMRPTVLPTPEVAAVVATEERNKLSGVKQAELEIRQDETSATCRLRKNWPRTPPRQRSGPRNGIRARLTPARTTCPPSAPFPRSKINRPVNRLFLQNTLFCREIGRLCWPGGRCFFEGIPSSAERFVEGNNVRGNGAVALGQGILGLIERGFRLQDVYKIRQAALVKCGGQVQRLLAGGG